MKKIISVLFLLLTCYFVKADAVVDSLNNVINSLPYSFEKADKIWDLAIYQNNSLKYPKEAIENFTKITEMFVEMDSLVCAMKTNASIFRVIFIFPEYFPLAKEAVDKHIAFLEDERFASSKSIMLTDFIRYLKTAYLLKEMDELKYALTATEKFFSDHKNDDIKIEYNHLYLLLTNYYFGEEVAIEKAMAFYDDVENDRLILNYPEKQLARIKLLATMQNFHYFIGNVDQSTKMLDEAIGIADQVLEEKPQEMTDLQYIHIRTYYNEIKTLKIDNIDITKDNLDAIERGYLDVIKHIIAYENEKAINCYSKIAHAYDVIYTGKHPKIVYYLNKVQENFAKLSDKVYTTNYYLTKARYLLNIKDYKNADEAFKAVEEFINISNQSWMRFNYVLERSRYYFETGQTKLGYDMVTEFYRSIDKDFSKNIAEKTAELNHQLDTQKLKNEQEKLINELEIKSLSSSRDKLITTLVGIVLGFTSLLLVNNVRLNKKLKVHLHKQGSQLKEEMLINQKRAQELIFTEKLSTSGQIASSIAHEIKNPLTNIITSANLLKDSNRKEDIEKYYAICDRNAWLAIDKINALLEYAKQKKLNFVDYSLKSVMKEAHNLSKGTLQKQDVNLQLIYHTHDDICNIDPKEITGVLVNLIINSIQAMDENKENKEINLILSNNEDSFIIEVVDNGSGIDAVTLKDIFNPFFTTKEKGSGLGLSYAQKVILEHRGDIQIESTPGEGTKVIISLPREK